MIDLFFKNISAYTNCVFNFVIITVFSEESTDNQLLSNDGSSSENFSYPDYVTLGLNEEDYANKPFEEYFNQAITYRNEYGVPMMPHELVGFQKPGSLDMATIISIHNDIYYLLFSILFLVSWFLFFSVIKNYKGTVPFSSDWSHTNKDKNEFKAACFESCSTTEIVWTVFPSFVLLFIGYPGISLLYSLDNQSSSDFYVKAIGHQWYWSYEYPLFKDHLGFSVSQDSNIAEPVNHIPDKDNIEFSLRNFAAFYYLKYPEYSKKFLHVDYPLVLPANVNVKIIVTSDDVLHSWAVPSLGVKIDACPGRLNQIELNCGFKTTRTFSNIRYTAYRGQCSEFCGVGHGFMPIVIKAIDQKEYFYYFYKYIILLDYYNWTHNKTKILARNEHIINAILHITDKSPISDAEHDTLKHDLKVNDSGNVREDLIETRNVKERLECIDNALDTVQEDPEMEITPAKEIKAARMKHFIKLKDYGTGEDLFQRTYKQYQDHGRTSGKLDGTDVDCIIYAANFKYEEAVRKLKMLGYENVELWGEKLFFIFGYIEARSFYSDNQYFLKSLEKALNRIAREENIRKLEELKDFIPDGCEEEIGEYIKALKES